MRLLKLNFREVSIATKSVHAEINYRTCNYGMCEIFNIKFSMGHIKNSRISYFPLIYIVNELL